MSGWLSPIVLSEIAAAHKFYRVGGFLSEVEFADWMQMLDAVVIEHFAPKKTPDKKGKDVL
jgi:hypothetical protein